MEGTALSTISEEEEEVPGTPRSAGVVTTAISARRSDPEADVIANLRSIGFDVSRHSKPRRSNKDLDNPKHKKSKGVIAALKKRSSEFFDSFKPADRISTSIQTHRSDLNDTFALLWGTGANPQEHKLQHAIAEIRKLQERGIEWWKEVTRKSQRDVAYSDSLTDLIRALQRTQGGVRGFVDDEGDGGSDEAGYLYFRCDVHAVNASDFTAAEKECKQLVIEAGGKVLDDYEYIGGFMYSLPATDTQLNPLADGDETLLGGHISIAPWMPFHPPQFDGLSPNPPGVFDAHPGPTKEWPRVTTVAGKRRMQNWILQQRLKADQAAVLEEQKARREAEEGEVVLGPRILEAGVELAILEPGRLMTRASEMELPVDEGEGSSSAGDDDERVECVARVADLRGAVSGRATPVYLTRGFGEEMRRVEGLYRNWVPSMSGGHRE